jgi:hypothetical protein
MSDFLVIGGWTGRRKIPVKIIGETPEGFRIKALERVLLPGRGFLEKGQSTLVSKSVIKLAEVRETQEVLPANKRAPLYAHAAWFFAKIRKTVHALVLSR